MKKTLHWHIFFIVLLLQLQHSFKWQYMAGAGAEAGAKIREVEPEPKINHFGSATLPYPVTLRQYRVVDVKLW